MKSLQSASAGHSIHGEVRPRELFTEARVSQLSHTAMSRAGLLTYLNVFIFTNFISLQTNHHQLRVSDKHQKSEISSITDGFPAAELFSGQ